VLSCKFKTEKPLAEIAGSDLTLLVGDQLTLVCIVSESTAGIKWKKSPGLVIPRAHIRNTGDKSTLVIEKVETGDSGHYSCEAHNQAGLDSSTVEIKVRGKMPVVNVTQKSIF